MTEFGPGSGGAQRQKSLTELTETQGKGHQRIGGKQEDLGGEL